MNVDANNFLVKRALDNGLPESFRTEVLLECPGARRTRPGRDTREVRRLRSRACCTSPQSLLFVLPVLASLLAGCATNVNDLLQEARKDGDPRSLQEAVIEIGRILQQKENVGAPFTEGDQAGIAYLREVATESADGLTRATAVAALGRLQRPALTELLLARLDDSFWAVRLEAARGLSARAVPAPASAVASRLPGEQRPEVRLELIKALARAGGEDALAALLGVLTDRTGKFASLRLVAHEAVKDLSQKDFAREDRYSWESYYEERFGERDPFALPEEPPEAQPSSSLGQPPAETGQKPTQGNAATDGTSS